MYIVGDTRRFAAHEENIVGAEGEIGVGGRPPRGGKDQSRASTFPPYLEIGPADMTAYFDLIDIIHARAPEILVRYRESGRLNEVRRHVETGAEAQHRSTVLRYVGLVKRQLHKSLLRKEWNDVKKGSKHGGCRLPDYGQAERLMPNPAAATGRVFYIRDFVRQELGHQDMCPRQPAPSGRV